MTAASNNADGRPPLSAAIGTVVFAGAFLSFVLIYVPYAITRWELDPPLIDGSLSRWLGALLIIAALPVMLDFLVRFVREGHGTPAPFAPPARLVVRGVYRYVRNPAYEAAVALVAGQALVFGSWTVLIYALCGVVFFHLFVVLYEEPTLREQFGADYEAYCREVPRWLPRLRGHRS